MASLAEFERNLIADRVKAGMERAKAQGKHTGRPALAQSKRKRIIELLQKRLQADDSKLSKRAIAREVGVGLTTVLKVESSL
jgi:DNA invertase Pin-like site-specific DNA recombinase